MITSSKLELAMKCRGAFTLPHLRETNEWSEGGHERHEANEAAINRGDIPPVLAETWPDHEWRAEVAFAYDVSTGAARELGQGIGRAYTNPDQMRALGIEPLSQFEVAGAADAVGRKDAHIVIYDKKGFGDVTRAAEHPQVRFYALCATRAYGLDAAEVATDHMLRGLDRADLEAFDLDETAHQVRQLLVDVAKAQSDARDGLPVEFTTGRHCRWCPAFMGPEGPQCPKQRELAALVRSGAADVRVENTIPFRDDGMAADAYEFAKQLRLLLKRVEGALYARGGDRPFAIGGGKMFGAHEAQGNEELNGDVVYEVVKARHGQAVADAAVERSATKTKLKEALKFVGAKGQVAALERAVLDEVRAKGGAERATKTKVGEFFAVPQLKAANE